MRRPRCLAMAILPATSLAHETLGAMERHVLPSAVCADGSPGHFYMAPNASSSDFMIYLQGGQGCVHSQAVCAALMADSPQLFTSEGFPHSVAGYSFLSEDEEQNPLYSTYNRVFVPYCTMDMYLLDTEAPDGGLQFRGRPLLEEALRTVLGPSKNDTTVVLGGSSAGGVGAFNAVEWLLDTFDQVTELSVILDSAFFFDVNSYLVPLLEYMADDPSIAYSPHCAEEFDRGPCCVQLGCMLQKGYYPGKAGRLRGTFALSGGQDVTAAIQTAALGVFDESIPQMLWSSAVFTGRTESSLRNLASLFPETLAVFSPSCIDHVFVLSNELDIAQCVPELVAAWVPSGSLCETTCVIGESGRAIGRTCVGAIDSGLQIRLTQSEEGWNTLQINGTSVRDALELWWEGRGDASKQVRMFDACDDPHCNPTCLGEFLTAGREGTESNLAWTLVLVTLGLATIILGAGISAVVWSCVQWNRVEAIVEHRLLVDMGILATGVKGSAVANGAMDPGFTQLQMGGAGDGATAIPALEWRDLSYWVPLKTGWSLPLPSWGSSKAGDVPVPEKQLLFSVDGSVPTGALCALMGPSGSGKSTLLDLLTGRRSIGRCEGDILFKGKSISKMQKSYIASAGYMRQSDVGMLPGLSVFDNLVYAAMIRIQGTLEHQLSRVQSVLEETSLVLVQNTVAGILSGGQKRRLMLALQLLAQRHILFLDEPTSGVDATASLELITVLKRVSKRVTVVVVIHQPRPEIWQLFSHTILVKGGRLVYCGPALDALETLSRFLPSPELQPTMQHAFQPTPRLPDPFFENIVRDDRDVSGGSLWNRGVSFSQDNLEFRARETPRNLSAASIRSRRDVSSTSVASVKRQGSAVSDRILGRGGKFVRSMSFNGRKLRILSGNEPDLDAEVAAATRSHRSVPDKLLDMLVRIEHEDVDRVMALEAAAVAWGGGAGFPAPFGLGTTKEEDSTNSEGPFTTSSFSSCSPASRMRRETETDAEIGVKTPLWEMSIVLMARSGKSGYAKNVVLNLSCLVAVITVMALAFREARGESEMIHLMVSVLFSMVLPVVLMYHPLMIENTWEEWALTKTEVADGFYPPVCATMRMAMDHLACGVVTSFIVVGIMHGIRWARFISHLPASDLGVNIQLSVGVTLIAWVMISMFDALAVSGLHLTMAFSVGVTLTSAWVFFSGTVLLLSSIPWVLRALTYTSPHYWNSSYMLRVILDGLDMTDTCAHNNPFYCARAFGDLVADGLDLRMRPNGYNLLAVVLFTIVSFAILVITVEVKGRHKGILDGLGPTKRRSSSFGLRRTTAPATWPMQSTLSATTDESSAHPS